MHEPLYLTDKLLIESRATSPHVVNEQVIP